jgi:16S rRNA (cytosine1402-N4)-methyltransferase
MSHIPVLVNEFLEYFKDQKIKIFFDGTLGAAGHAKAILENHPEIEEFIGTDQDETALEMAKKTLEPWKEKIKLHHGNFSQIGEFLKNKKADGIFFDVGVSSMQMDDEIRGFSFRYDAPLDMRMNKKADLTASDVVNSFRKEELEKIFKELGEERKYKAIAKAIIEKRRQKKIETTKDLLEIVKPICRAPRGKKIHPATLVFQALRIFVNDELLALEKGILQGLERLNIDGRFGVISFHRGEDRIVKNLFRDKKKQGYLVLTKKPITPTKEEVYKNRRSSSAKMRFIEREE